MNQSYNPNQSSSSSSSSQSSQVYGQSSVQCFPQSQSQGQVQSYGQSQGQSLAYNQVQAQQSAQQAAAQQQASAQAYGQSSGQSQVASSQQTVSAQQAALYQQQQLQAQRAAAAQQAQVQAQQAAQQQAAVQQAQAYSQSYGQSQVAASQQVVSAQQVAQATQPQSYAQQPASQFMTPEELQRTQVLNLDDVKATARIERLSSKKPAALVASFGVLLIAIGFFFPTIQYFATRHASEANETVYREEEEEEETVVTPVKETLSCSLSKLNNANGTDELLIVTYSFENSVIQTYTKEYTLRQSEGVTETPTELASYLEALEPFLAKQVPGYVMTLQQIANGSVTKTTVNYNELDYTQIPVENQANYRFDVPFQATTPLNDVRSGLITQGYTCD